MAEVSNGGANTPIVDAAQIQTRTQFGAALKALRESAGLTIKMVAEKSGVPAGTLSGWFGGSAVPSLVAVEQFRAVLSVCGGGDQFDGFWGAANRIRGIERPARPTNSPYRGLTAYTAADAALFFGRSDLIAELGARVLDGVEGRGTRLVGVLGASGAGKSSLLQAGLLVWLGERGCPAVCLTPGADPLVRLESALAESGRHPGSRAVIVVDQSEELWTYNGGTGGGAATAVPAQFVQRLIELCEEGVVVVFAIRTDFFAPAVEIPELEQALTADAVVVRPMTAAQLEQVIVEPARARGGVTVDPALVEVLLQELAVAGCGAHDPGALPLLSHALHETWSTRTTATSVLTVEHYRATGGFRGAVGQTAEKVWDGLDRTQRAAAERLFLRGVHQSETGLVRTVVRPDELDWPDIPRLAMDAVIDRFVGQRLLTATEEGVQITHEALLHAWDKLGDWIEQDIVGHRMQKQLAELARNWIRDDPSTLLSAARTDEYQKWARNPAGPNLTLAEARFLEASSDHHAMVAAAEVARMRRLRMLVGALVATVVVLIPVSVFAFNARSDAVLAEASTRTALDLAVSGQAIAKAEDVADLDSTLAQQLSLIAYRKAPTAESRSALLDSTTLPISRRLSIPGMADVRSQALSTDESLLAVSDGQHLRVVDRRSRGQMSPEVALPEIVATSFDLRFRPNSTTLAVMTSRSVQLWDFSRLADPRKTAEINHGQVPLDVDEMVWAEDGTELAVSTDRTVLRWMIGASLEVVELPRLHREPTGPLGSSIGLSYSPDRRWLVGAGPQPTDVQIWDAAAASPPTILHVPLAKRIGLSVRISSDSTTLTVFEKDGVAVATALNGTNVPNWVAADGLHPQNSAGGTGDSRYHLVDSDGRDITIADSDSSTRHTVTGPIGSVTLAHNLDPAVILIASDGFIREWTLPRPRPVPEAGVEFSSAVMDQHGRTALLQTDEGLSTSSLALGEFATIGVQALGTSRYSTNPAITDDGRFAAIELWASAGSAVQILGMQDPVHPRALGAEIALDVRPTWALAVTPRADAVFVAAGDVVMRIDAREPTDRTTIAEIRPSTGEFVRAMQVSPDGRWLAVGTTRTLRVYDTDSPEFGQPAATWAEEVHWLRFGPDSSTLISGNIKEVGEAAVTHLDPSGTITRTSTVQGPRNPVTPFIGAAAVNSARTRLALATHDEIWIWDISEPTKPTRFATLRRSAGSVTALAYSVDDSNLIALQSRDGKAILRTWPSDVESIAAEICTRPHPRIEEPEWARYFPGTPFAPPCPR